MDELETETLLIDAGWPVSQSGSAHWAGNGVDLADLGLRLVADR